MGDLPTRTTQRIVCPWKLPCTQSTRSLQGRVLPCTRIKILSLKNIALYPYFVPKSLIFRSFSHSSIFSVSIWLISTIYFVIYFFVQSKSTINSRHQLASSFNLYWRISIILDAIYKDTTRIFFWIDFSFWFYSSLLEFNQLNDWCLYILIVIMLLDYFSIWIFYLKIPSKMVLPKVILVLWRYYGKVLAFTFFLNGRTRES